jgi:hypothetical protein
MQTVKLPNGLQVCALNQVETAVLYHEMFVEQTYSKHGITVADGDCVFDVGANIGLYSVLLAQSRRGLKIFAFEPIPETFAALQGNASRHLTESEVKLFCLGLSDRSGEACFEFDRFASLAATMHPQGVKSCARHDARLYEWARAGIADLQRISHLPARLAQFLLKALAVPVLRSLVAFALLTLFLWPALRGRLFLQRIERQVKTISEVMSEHQVELIDVLKIDVEGSELNVISGIAPEDWQKIKQFVVEVHDINGRVEQLRAIFESHGYRTTLDREDWEIHPLLGISTLYAVRQ